AILINVDGNRVCGHGPPTRMLPPKTVLLPHNELSTPADTVATMILVVAATPEELRGADGAATLVCGVGPVEAAARTAAALSGRLPDAVLHVGIAGGRSFDEPSFV